MSNEQERKFTMCKVCEKGDGTIGTVRTFATKYGYRQHLLHVHGLKEKDGKLVKVRSRRNPIRHPKLRKFHKWADIKAQLPQERQERIDTAVQEELDMIPVAIP